MILKTMLGEMKEIKCNEMEIDIFSIFMTTRFEDYVDIEDERYSTIKEVIYGIKRYLRSQKEYFNGYELLFDINDIYDLLDNTLTASMNAADC
ncbi:hypothetical protein [Clostridium lacusfryxellense]|uniref:hypothetical protein n=1 Tax=Clostridium lacusfryxellense TaxID=205328 RepID=UPI001C0D3CD5|nr:hypothetical protein [Clostridium lacusfryxellense]MBU3114618.1 hypothetical protein [Clostridium lacusfryxellense]